MAVKKIQLPNSTVVDINDARNVVIGDGVDNMVALTNAQYQALSTKDPETVYIVTDADPGGGGGGGGSGTVTSVAMSVPTGLSVSGSPITTSGTLAVSFANGYSIPTTTKQGQWDAKADDSDVVHKSGAETISGNKNFYGTQTFDDCNVVFDSGSELINATYTDFSWVKTSNGSGGSKTLQSELNTKQATLVSGTNIKTVNNQSLLGSGNITISGGGGGDTSDCVHKTGDETIGGDKTFSDNIEVVDASHILYSGGGGGGGGFTRATAFKNNTSAANSIAFAELLGEPKAFVVTVFDPAATGAKVVAIVGDSTGLHGVYNTGSQHNYSSGFTKSYSSGTLTVTAPSGVTFAGATTYDLVYYYGDGTLTFMTSTIQPGSGVTAVTFTGTDLTEMPVMYATFLETAVNNESYRRVACYTNSAYDADEGERSFGATFFSNNAPADTTSSFSVSYNNGLYINSGGTNAGGYFHNPGTYTLYYLMASDVASGGGGGGSTYSSLADELDGIRDTIGDIETLLAAI